MHSRILAPVRLNSLSVAVAAILFSGCGGGGHVPVSGKVLLDGKAIKVAKGETAAVNFYPDKQGAGSFGIGPVDENGEYEISSDKKPGIKAGTYKVTVTYSKPSDPKNPYSAPKRLVNQKYGDVNTTQLEVEVKADTPPGHYDLRVTK